MVVVSYKFEGLTDSELMDRLKGLSAQWFKNDDILLLEELFRRYQRAKIRTVASPS